MRRSNPLKTKRPEGIYTNEGPREHLLCYKAKVNGEKALAYYKEGKDTSYILLKDVLREFDKTPCLEIVDMNR